MNIDPSHPRNPVIAEILTMAARFDDEQEPFAIKGPDGRRLGTLHWGQSALSTRIRVMPYLELSIMALFFLIIMWALQNKKQAEQTALFAGMAKETAHQLGTPLTSIMGWVALLEQKVDPGSDLMVELNRDVDRLGMISARFSQIGSLPKLEDTDLMAVVDDTIEYFRRRLPHLGGRVQLRREGYADAPVRFNRDLLGWVLENLIKNGIDALADGKGTITVKVEDRGAEGVALLVSRTRGAASPPASGTASSTRVSPPSSAAGAWAWRWSSASSCSTTAAASASPTPVPAAPPSASPCPRPRPEPKETALAFRILWVDDNIEELRSHVVYLGEKGYEVDGATNGRDAIALLGEKNYDAVLLDEMMPGMGGLETLEEMRKINARIPVIMITKSEAEDLMTRAIGKRIDDYLVKPVSPLQILSALKRQLEGRKLTGETVMRDYMANFMAVSDRIGTAATPADWESIYVDLVTWGMDIFQYSDHGLLVDPRRPDERRQPGLRPLRAPPLPGLDQRRRGHRRGRARARRSGRRC